MQVRGWPRAGLEAILLPFTRAVGWQREGRVCSLYLAPGTGAHFQTCRVPGASRHLLIEQVEVGRSSSLRPFSCWGGGCSGARGYCVPCGRPSSGQGGGEQLDRVRVSPGSVSGGQALCAEPQRPAGSQSCVCAQVFMCMCLGLWVTVGVFPVGTGICVCACR